VCVCVCACVCVRVSPAGATQVAPGGWGGRGESDREREFTRKGTCNQSVPTLVGGHGVLSCNQLVRGHASLDLKERYLQTRGLEGVAL